MKKFLNRLLCAHKFEPFAKETSFVRVETWHPESQSYMTSEKQDGTIIITQCRCGKTNHEFFK
jgi:hypothetical protein